MKMARDTITARRIIRTLKGWSAKDEADDRRDHPEAHGVDLAWLLKQLARIRHDERVLAAHDIVDLRERLVAAKGEVASLNDLLRRALSLGRSA